MTSAARGYAPMTALAPGPVRGSQAAARPLGIRAVVTGSVFKTLEDIDGLSDHVELLSFALGGCGKMEQFPLPVGFGGPWVRVKELTVR